jgi:hypothetical protein
VLMLVLVLEKSRYLSSRQWNEMVRERFGPCFDAQS